MKNVRFYLEFPSSTEKHKPRAVRKHSGNVAAVFVDDRGRFQRYFSDQTCCVEGLAGIYEYPNSPVASGGMGVDWLRKQCVRISEEKAREIHPALFERLDISEL